jgi:LPS O-antigen subunit length determinant protein (WzzB/FepE family)
LSRRRWKISGNQITLKTKVVQQQLELDHVRLTNIHNTNLQRLNYSLKRRTRQALRSRLQQRTGGKKTILTTPWRWVLTVLRNAD